jgi:phosphatidate phosphatase APP1
MKFEGENILEFTDRFPENIIAIAIRAVSVVSVFMCL